MSTETNKEPAEFSEFFAAASAKVRGFLEKRAAERLRRDQTPQATILGWQADVARAARVRTFVEGEFWKNDLEPFMRQKSAMRPWAPGSSASLDQATIEYLHGSGKVSAYTETISEFSRWLRLGQEAEENLLKEQRRVRV